MTVAAALASPFIPSGASSFSLAASLSPTSLSQTGTTSMITTGNCTCTPTGGTPPYSYSWSLDSTDSITAISPTSATTTFKRLSCLSGETYYGTGYCTVTDALGAKVTTPGGVTITITRS